MTVGAARRTARAWARADQDGSFQLQSALRSKATGRAVRADPVRLAHPSFAIVGPWPMEQRGPDTDWSEQTDLWEHQGEPLTVGRLRQALASVENDLPIGIAFYDGTGQVELNPVEVGFTGVGSRPGALVITAGRT